MDDGPIQCPTEANLLQMDALQLCTQSLLSGILALLYFTMMKTYLTEQNLGRGKYWRSWRMSLANFASPTGESISSFAKISYAAILHLTVKAFVSSAVQTSSSPAPNAFVSYTECILPTDKRVRIRFASVFGGVLSRC